MNNPAIPDPPTRPPEAAYACCTARRSRLNKFGFRDRKRPPPNYTLGYWQLKYLPRAFLDLLGRIAATFTAGAAPIQPRRRRGQQLIKGPLYNHRSTRHAQATARTAIILALSERRDKTGEDTHSYIRGHPRPNLAQLARYHPTAPLMKR
jgi:hypothetical protein